MTEGLLLAAVGGLSGLACAAWASRGLGAIIFEDYVITVGFDPTPDRRVASFAIATALLFGALFTLLPAWQGNPPTAARPATADSRTTTARSAGRWLVAAQVALSLVLLIAAGLFVRTLQAIRSTTDGLSSAGVVVAFPFPRPGAYSHLDNDIYYRQHARSSLGDCRRRARERLARQARGRRHRRRRARGTNQSARHHDERRRIDRHTGGARFLSACSGSRSGRGAISRGPTPLAAARSRS